MGTLDGQNNELNKKQSNSTTEDSSLEENALPQICVTKADSSRSSTPSSDTSKKEKHDWEELKSKLCQCEKTNNSNAPPCYYCSSSTFDAMPSLSTFTIPTQTYNNFRRPSCPNLKRASPENFSNGLRNDSFVGDTSSHGDRRRSTDSTDESQYPVNRNSDLPENMTPLLSVFCEYRLQKLACSIPAAVLTTIAIAGVDATVTTLFNMSLLMTIMVFYPLFGGIAFLITLMFPQLKSIRRKCSSDANTPDQSVSGSTRSNVFTDRRPSFQSFGSRVSSMGNLPSIAEEQSSEDGDSIYDEFQCQMCLHERFLGVCTHHGDTKSEKSRFHDPIEIVVLP